MTDQDLSRWIARNVFGECWHELYDIYAHPDFEGEPSPNLVCTCGLDVKWSGELFETINEYGFDAVEWHFLSLHSESRDDWPNPNLCTPDGSAMLKAKAQELGVWDEFVLSLPVPLISGLLPQEEGDLEGWGIDDESCLKFAEIMTMPRLMCEEFKAFWQERGK